MIPANEYFLQMQSHQPRMANMQQPIGQLYSQVHRVSMASNDPFYQRHYNEPASNEMLFSPVKQ